MTEVYAPRGHTDTVLVAYPGQPVHRISPEGWAGYSGPLFPDDLVWSPETAEAQALELDAIHAKAFDEGQEDGRTEGYNSAVREHRDAVLDLARRLGEIDEVTALVTPGVVRALSAELLARLDEALPKVTP